MIDTLIRKFFELEEKQPEKVAVAFKNEQLTYKRLCERICGMAVVLRENGVEKSDRVCFMALSKPEMVVAYLGIQMIGAVPVFLDKNSTAENIALVYEACGAALLLCDKPLKDAAKDLNVKSLKKFYEASDETSKDKISKIKEEYAIPDEDKLAEILFTTGSTGTPKGVKLAYKSVHNIYMNTIEGIGISKDEIMLLPLPLNHSFALRVLRATLYQGATVILQNGFTFAKAVEENIEKFSCTAMACVPASYEVMKSQMQNAFSLVLSKLKYIEFGAGSLSVAQRLEISKLLPDVHIYNTWGSSESGGAIFCDVTDCVNKGGKVVSSLGRPLKGKVEVRVLAQDAPIDDPEKINGHLEEYFIDGNESNPGRMTLKGDMQMVGYWNNEEQTQQTLIDGWLLTGDLAYTDDEDNVYMLGRADDIINVGGEKVSPIEVENIAGQYEFIKECACLGVEDPDHITGQAPALFVVTKTGYVEEDFVKFLSVNMERYKMPKVFIKLLELPRNRMQKVDRKKLTQIYNGKEDKPLMNPIVENLLTRRSVRKFTDQEIPREILDVILKCGYYAPSGHNLQTWQFTVIEKAEDIARLKESAEKAAKENNVNFYGWENPKVLVLVSNDNRNPLGCQDASNASENMMLAAHSFGIGSVWLNPLMTLRDVSPVSEILTEFGVPKNHTVWSTIAMGYSLTEGAFLKKKENVIKFV